jgi:hypothetical protein
MKGDNMKRGHPEVYKLMEKAAELYDAKNTDYSGEKDPLINLRACEDIGIPAWKGVLIRMSDKFSRIKQLSTKTANVKDETITDTLLDLSVYCLLCIVLYNESKKWQSEK